LSLFGVRSDEGGFYGVVDLFSHEIAHQWWGNLVAPGASDSVWLSEGFAEFSSKLHSEQRTGSRWGFMANGMSYVYGVPAADDSAIADTLTLINPHYVTIEYSKGSCVLDMLRHELGEGIFFELLQAYAERFGEGLATVADFEALAAEVSGQDLAWFFEQWLHRTGYPRATLGVERGSQATEGGLLLHVDQDPASFFRFTLPLRARCADGETEWVQAPVDAASVSVTLTACGGAVRGLDPDPERRLLRRFSTGMSPDINLDGSSDAADLLDMAWYYGRDIVFDGRDGGSWFWPNGSYRDLADLTGPTPEKPDGRVDMTDVELLVALLEAVSWTDPRSR
ncbi:MAG: hypothetical protein FJ098_07290, partial [Deltaproteobacteria bacterium]|nr:hypothetical protein [Deltaproteobacteria bacterium]